MEKVNSRDYWDKRYETGDWEKFDGEGQSEFFAKIILSELPIWAKKELNNNQWSVIDYGCAEGAGTSYLAKYFPICRFFGTDFSETAIKIARKKYSNCDFHVFDLYGNDDYPKYDVTLSSNVLEHLEDPFTILERIVKSSNYFSLILIPFEDNSGTKEHINIFGADILNYQINGYTLSNAIVSDWRDGESPFWKEKQVLLVYVNNSYRNNFKKSFASDFYLENLQPLQDAVLNEKKKTANITLLNEKYVNDNNSLKQENERISALNEKYVNDNNSLKQENERISALNEDYLSENDSLKRDNERIIALNEEYSKENTVLKQKIEEISSMNQKLSADYNQQRDIFQENTIETGKVLSSVIDNGYALSTIKSFKFAHFISRWKYQFLRGNSEEKRNFFTWLFKRGKKHPNNERTYNPLFQLIIPLENLRDHLADENKSSDVQASALVTFSPEEENERNEIEFPFLKEEYSKYDVIVLGVIDYDFRYQRPQQIADFYCKNDHRVFYVNANFTKDRIKETQTGCLWRISLTASTNAIYSLNEFSDEDRLQESLESVINKHGIRDGIIIVDYPKWVKIAYKTSNKYGFKLVTDYMDDYTGFITTADSKLKKDCIDLLKASNCVVASSQYLSEIVKQYNEKVTIVRNGTDFNHFLPAFSGNIQNKKKVIGYYGAIAEWFDFEKVKYVAEKFPDADIMLVGDITNAEVKKCNLPNIIKVGEVPYSSLPDYLKKFDVCLIPFDTSTNLIKATNPVKFYEYLSAGKKIVATRIPEIEQYENKFAYLTDDNEEFAEDVKKCLQGSDCLANAEECMSFAKENTWENRVSEFESFALTAFPKISIIILCYNQLDYTKKCVESILRVTAYPNYEIILIDNCSTDNTSEYLKEISAKYSNIRIKINNNNRGFAGGNNDGIQMAKGDFIVLLNNDTVVTRGWLSGMLKQFSIKKNVGIVGAVTNSIGNEAAINVNYTDIDDMPYFAYQYTSSHMGMIYPHVNVLAMFCVMFPKALISKVGMLDENYGRGMFEDDDYSMAALKAGYSLVLPEDVYIHHFGSVSFNKLGDSEYRKIFEKNKAYFENKWNVKWQPHHYRQGKKKCD